MNRSTITLAALAALTPMTCAQVVINEVQENPSGGGIDPFHEYIELYGKPGMPLDGYVIALLKGGTGDPVEIDECFSLDGHALGSNGLFVLFNDTDGGTLLPLFPLATTSAGFTQTHVATTDTPGNLANDDSSTYVLLRGRPATGSAGFPTDWRKDIAHDVNADSNIDFPHVVGARILEPYQMVDDIAFSNNMGMEYTRQDIDELDETPGFNPDALTRMNYFSNAGPGPGVRAEEAWVRGEMLNTSTYDYDLLAMGAPADVDTAGARLTPGDFNTFASAAQFTFIPGDLNFDSNVDNDDYVLAQSLLGATRDDREDCFDEGGAPVIDPATGSPYPCFTYQGRDFNALEALRCLVTDDGIDAMNAEEVTQQDIDAVLALVTDCEVDYAAPFGSLDFSDVIAFLTLFGSGDPAADLAEPFGVYDFSDVISFLSSFGNCFP